MKIDRQSRQNRKKERQTVDNKWRKIDIVDIQQIENGREIKTRPRDILSSDSKIERCKRVSQTFVKKERK